MAPHHKYQAVHGEDEEACEKPAGWDIDSEIIPTNRRSFIACLSLLLLSVSTNILLVLENSRLQTSSRDLGKSIYTGNTFDTLVPFHAHSDFWNPNVSESISDAAWDGLETNPIAVALHDDFAKQVGLGPSTRFPWDTERSIYYIKGFHDLHCLKLIRKAIVSKHRGEDQNFTMNHIYHCLDSLRQDVMCAADDTPLPAAREHEVGEGQLHRCRDWEKLTAWATRPDQNACHSFDDYREATHSLELFAFCPPDSPYRSVMEAYFAYHGHKDPYEDKSQIREKIF